MTEVCNDGSSKNSWDSLSEYFTLICYDLVDNIYTVKIPEDWKVVTKDNSTIIRRGGVTITSRVKKEKVPYVAYVVIKQVVN